MTDFDDVARRYIDVFNETDPAARRQKVAALWTAGGTYTDPLADVAGHDGIDGFVAAAQAQLAGFEFRLLGPVEGHHDQARFRWEAGPTGALGGGAEAPVVGFDVVVTDADGRVERVHGFLDRAPAA
ncbi:nuclear transport factor 2 family protein [Pseudonocardia sp. KRD291]|uniref:nuclear transport factor 2 family protein n=1 Tax=Pseudonocardia sp. KRD291 TaxID=2792007 RepID=UPI001C4A2F1E|nr:nuclear transport factor 2 family protein [Pseudonocardia sp. KRD291]MBW0103354.1 nuclear transport factor 2 family protein [Pseudonocardia sp. KRD291]